MTPHILWVLAVWITPFRAFNGNGKTVTLISDGGIAVNSNMSPFLGLFGRATYAKIINTNMKVTQDLLVVRSTQKLSIGPLVGKAQECEITNCNVTIVGANVGADYSDSEKYVAQACVGGLVGESAMCTISDCTVTICNGTLQAKGYDVVTGTRYANFSVGGMLGFSHPGSDNAENIGQVGNQLIGCQVIVRNTTQRETVKKLRLAAW